MTKMLGGLLILTLSTTGCVSHTRITTEVNATIIEADSGRAIGTGQGDYSDSKPVWGSTTFRIEKEGCETKELTIHRSDDISVGMVIGGFFLIIPWLWAGDYHRSYGVSLQCGRKAGSGH
ncbi:MAG: hypothetical protein KC613_15020 [Myxococcales bacterium]|nr:hypothetical protein [Myxococcales bacterium]